MVDRHFQNLNIKAKSNGKDCASPKENPPYSPCFTYMHYDWRRCPVITLMGTVAMNKQACRRKVPKLDFETRLFPQSTPVTNR